MTRPRIPHGLFVRQLGDGPPRYARLNGRRRALVPPGQKRATTDLEVAKALFGQLTAEDQKRTLRGVHGVPEPVSLAAYTAEHLVKKAQANRVTDQALAADERHLGRATEFFGVARELASINVPTVTGWIAALRDRGSGPTRSCITCTRCRTCFVGHKPRAKSRSGTTR